MKKGVLICFIGPDGSGKTTLSRYLYEELKKCGYNVSCTWWLEGENSLLRRLLRRMGKLSYSRLDALASSSNVDRSRSILKGIFGTLFPIVVFLDYLRFGIIRAWLPKIVGGAKIIIFDRFMYDVVLALSKEFNFSDSRRQRLFGIFGRLLPQPDLVFMIDVPPEISYLRKKDEIKSVVSARTIWEDYQELYSLMSKLVTGKIVRVDNTAQIETAKAETLKATLELLEANKNGK